MKFNLSWPELLCWTDHAPCEGTPPEAITGIAALEDAAPGDLSFLSNPKYKPQVATCQASVILLPVDYEGSAPSPGQAYLRVEHPSRALGEICGRLQARLEPPPPPGIHPTATIADSATIAPTASIGPHCVISDDVSIAEGCILHAQAFVGPRCCLGQNCLLHPRVTLYADTELHERVIVHAGCVIGSDGFGYEQSGGVHVKIPQIGSVLIESDVEIGANTTIDRARFGLTRIGPGSKIDNLVQIAHNVHTGQGCILCAQAGISGSTTLGDYVIMAGQAGAAGHLKLASGTILGAQAGAAQNTAQGTYYRGTPALEAPVANKADVLRKRLPELFRRVSALEAKLPPETA